MVELVAKDVQSRAQRALQNSPIYELRDLQIEQHNGVISISGIVSSFYYKQLAQELIRALCQDERIELVNSIRVR